MEEGSPLIANTASFLDEEAVVISNSEFGIKTEDEKYAIDNSGLTSRLFLQEKGTNKYKLTSAYDDNTIFGETRQD